MRNNLVSLAQRFREQDTLPTRKHARETDIKEALEKLVEAEKNGREFYFPTDVLKLDPVMESLVRRGYATKRKEEDYAVYAITKKGHTYLHNN